MRSVGLLLLVLALGGGLYWVMTSGDDVASDGDLLVGGGDPTQPAGTTKAMRSKPTDVIGIWGQGGGIPRKPLDFPRAMETKVQFSGDRKEMTGGAVLDVLEKQVGSTMPIRFPSEASLELFRKSKLEMEVPAKAYVTEVLDWFQHMGYMVEHQPTFVFVRKRRKSEQ